MLYWKPAQVQIIYVHLPILYSHRSSDVVHSSFKEIAHLEISFLTQGVCLNYCISVVYDGKKHVLKYKYIQSNNGSVEVYDLLMMIYFEKRKYS